MLKLRIENFDNLPDGGPLEYSVDRRGFDFGRDSHLDWTLPDKNRVVSGKHCEVRFYDDAYWLHDVSTNGTYLNNSDKRMQSPYKLQDNDRLNIGEYIIAVSVSAPQPRKAVPVHFEAMPMPPPPTLQGSSVWDAPDAAPHIDPRDLMPPPPPGERAPDFLNKALFVPDVVAPYEDLSPVVAPRISSAWNPDPLPAAASPAPPRPSNAQPAPAVAPMPTPAGPAPSAAGGASAESQWTRQFAKGAGLPEDTFERAEPGALAELLGQMIRTTSSELMALLQSRAEAKALSRGGRTMIRATDNNPLKFLPTPEEALLAMFLPRGKGYLGANETLEKSFADLKQHHIALLAAMQAAANQMLQELSPQQVLKTSGDKKSLLGSAKGRHWDEIERLWTSKAAKRENGILDVFLDEFAEHYEKFSKRKS